MSTKKFNYVKWGFLVALVGSIATVLAIIPKDIVCSIGLLSDTCVVPQKDVELVTKTETGEALEGVKVEVIAKKRPPEPELTDSNGYAKIKILAEGDVLVTLSKSGYPTKSFSINLLIDQNRVRVIRLTKSGQLEVSSLPKIPDVVASVQASPVPSPTSSPSDSKYKKIAPIRVEIKPERSVYTELDQIKVLFNIEGTPKESRQWMTVVAASKAENAYEAYEYIGNSGSVVFKSKPPGDYNVRLFINTGSGDVPVSDCPIIIKSVAPQ